MYVYMYVCMYVCMMYVCMYVCMCIVTRKFKGFDSREISSFPKIKKRDENMACHFNHRRE